MKDRLVTLLGALLALAIVYSLFLKRPDEPPVAKPISTEAGRNGYLAVWRWLEREHVKVVSLRNRYPTLLDDSSLAETGNVLIVTMPFRLPLRQAESEAFRSWVQRGNAVLLLAALDDSPDWAGNDDPVQLARQLSSLSRLTFPPFAIQQSASVAANNAGQGNTPATPAHLQPIAPHTRIELDPRSEHPLLSGVGPLYGYSDDAADIWTAQNPDPERPVLRLGTESTTGADAIWQVPMGDGEIIVAASGSLLANRNVGEGGTRDLVRNILHYRLGDGGAVIFDDMHQGLSSLYDPAALLRDSRLHYTIWFVLAAWLVYVLGTSNRLAPPRVPRSVPKQGDFVAAAGGFMARRLDRSAAGRLLLDEWLDEVRRARGLPRGAPLWPELEATPTLARGVYEELHAYDRTLAGGGAVDLVRLHNTLLKAREGIG
jgi:hypothetical protein